MPCAHNRVLDALEKQITDWLTATYGSSCIASRDLSIDPDTLQAEATPRVYIWETARPVVEPADQVYSLVKSHLMLVGVIKRSDTNKGTMQSLICELEAVLDQLWELYVLDGLSVEFTPTEPDQPLAGVDEGRLIFPVAVKYARNA
jgi:hypothetical protein